MSFSISMGVRKDDTALADELNRVLDKRQSDIRKILCGLSHSIHDGLEIRNGGVRPSENFYSNSDVCVARGLSPPDCDRKQTKSSHTTNTCGDERNRTEGCTGATNAGRKSPCGR